MKKTISFILVLIFIGCAKVPISGRRQLNLLPETNLIAISNQQYKQFLNQAYVIENTPSAELVKKVGSKLSAAVELYMIRNGHSKRLEGFDWEFKIVKDRLVNAWCMPGGKICVYTGILEVTKDETGLAVVMGHEIAHAIARHGNERLSKNIAVQMGGVALSVAIMNKGAQTQELFQQAYGVSSGLGALAFSRKNELESDKLGLVFMHLAGYDASKASAFWERMAEQSSDHPEFLSTHPSDERRIDEIKFFLNSEKFKKHTSQ